MLESRDLVWSRLIYLLLTDDFGIDLNVRHFPSAMLESRRPLFPHLRMEGLRSDGPRPLWELKFIFPRISEEGNEVLRLAFFLFKRREMFKSPWQQDKSAISFLIKTKKGRCVNVEGMRN